MGWGDERLLGRDGGTRGYLLNGDSWIAKSDKWHSKALDEGERKGEREGGRDSNKE